MTEIEKRIDIAEGLIKINYERVKLDFWQSHYLEHDFPFMILNKSRRIGWSWITALKGLIDANSLNNYRYNKIFVSYNLADATEKIAYARMFYYSLPVKTRKKLVSESKTILEFLDKGGKTKSRLISLPCRAPYGQGGEVSLDEFAFHKKDSEIYQATLPVISRGGAIEIGSTPYSKAGKFYELTVDPLGKYTQFERWEIPWWYSSALCTDVEKALNEALNLTTEHRVRKFGTEILNQIFDSLSLAEFQAQYECQFTLDESEAFISLKLIQACTPLGEEEIIPFRSIDDMILGYNPAVHGSLYAGYDIGRKKNQSVLTIVGAYPDNPVKKAWASIEYNQVEFDTQEKNLKQFMDELPVIRLCIDSTGLGMHLAENLSKKYPARVEGIDFSNPIKELLSNNIYLDFERTECLIPADRDLQLQIYSIKKTITLAKHPRFDCEANLKHHADRYWGLALAIHAVGTAKHKSRFYDQFKKSKDKKSKVRKKTQRSKSREEVIAQILRRGRY